MRPFPEINESSCEESTNDDELNAILKAMRAYDAEQRQEQQLMRGTSLPSLSVDSGSQQMPLDTSDESRVRDDAVLGVTIQEQIHMVGGSATTMAAGSTLPFLGRSTSTQTPTCSPMMGDPGPRRAWTDSFALLSRSSDSHRHPRGVYRQPLCRSHFLNKELSRGATSASNELKDMNGNTSLELMKQWCSPGEVTSNDTSDDEALAKQLQDEWNQEVASLDSCPSLIHPSVESQCVDPDELMEHNHFNDVTRSCGAIHLLDALHISGETSSALSVHYSGNENVHVQQEPEKLTRLKSSRPSFHRMEWHDESSYSYSQTDDDWSSSCASSSTHAEEIAPAACHSSIAVAHDALNERERFLHEGLLVTAKSILFGQYKTVTCQGCQEQLRTPLDYPLVYCQGCGVVSPTGRDRVTSSTCVT